jgi:hypothetical protein
MGPTSHQEAIAAAFNDHFRNFGIRIEPRDVVPGERRSLSHRGWRVSFRIDPDDSGAPALEFYATHRMTSDRHVRIWADGQSQQLEAIDEFYVFDPKQPGSEEASRRRYEEHNRKVAQELRERGLYPHGDINAYLRTHGSDIDSSRRGDAEEHNVNGSAP